MYLETRVRCWDFYEELWLSSKIHLEFFSDWEFVWLQYFVSHLDFFLTHLVGLIFFRWTEHVPFTWGTYPVGNGKPPIQTLRCDHPRLCQGTCFSAVDPAYIRIQYKIRRVWYLIDSLSIHYTCQYLIMLYSNILQFFMIVFNVFNFVWEILHLGNTFDRPVSSVSLHRFCDPRREEEFRSRTWTNHGTFRVLSGGEILP